VNKVAAFAPAKINLTLSVGPPRGDGRHPLTSVVVFADIGDWVTIDNGEPGFRITGPFAGDLAGETDNLVTRALSLLPGAGGLRVMLEKHLPIASGIGGGSADAAAALRAARALLGLALDDDELERRAAALGADAPACVRSRAAWMSGTGETLVPIEAPTLHAVLVNPGIRLATKDVYRRFDEMRLGGDFVAAPAPRWRDAEAALRALTAAGNDLEPPARALAPAVGVTLDRLRADRRTLLARLSGSGATCFSLVAGPGVAAGLAETLADEQPTWWVRAAQLGAVDVTPTRG
jgi:4-diphosphocytidyl-2-C-methyl-D-erythritol kinase